jgi:hypothetical protein
MRGVWLRLLAFNSPTHKNGYLAPLTILKPQLKNLVVGQTQLCCCDQMLRRRLAWQRKAQYGGGQVCYTLLMWMQSQESEELAVCSVFSRSLSRSSRIRSSSHLFINT